jgi:signal transduction histidine kinase
MAASPETRPIGQSHRTAAGTGAVLAIAGSVLVAGAVAIVAADTAPRDRALALTVHVLSIGLPIALGAFRLSRRSDDRFARLLVGSGLLWSLTTLAESSNATLYSLGRVAVWLVEPVLVYLLLAFPWGRLTTAVERRLAWAAVAVSVLLYLPTALVSTSYPTPSPFSSCGTDCPHNALAVTSSTPGVVDGFVRPLREVLAVLIFAGVAALLVRRARRGVPLMRRKVAPVAAVAVARVLLISVYFSLRAADAAGGGARALGWVWMLSLVAITTCFAVGLVRERLFVATALQRLTLELTTHARPQDLRVALADALEDRSLTILYWVPADPGRWVDEAGWPAAPPRDDPAVAVTQVGNNGRPVAAIVHDVALSQDPELVQAASAYALTALENDRLVGRLRTSLLELSESRSRIMSVADGERSKVERDLHDGAQQRLVALQIKLELVATQVQDVSPKSAAAIRGLEDEVDATIDEVRAFARGVYPSLLAERGLSEALRAAGRSAPVPTMVDAPAIGRYSPEVEATVYFACMEALQNVAKHAHEASGVMISVSQNERLRFEVRDDGEGFDARRAEYGAGLTNLRDRLDAVGGTLDVRSVPGRGTTISGAIPATPTR